MCREALTRTSKSVLSILESIEQMLQRCKQAAKDAQVAPKVADARLSLYGILAL